MALAVLPSRATSFAAPGGSATIVWTFNCLGEFDFACLVAGHFGAGMVGRIRVVPRRGG